MDIGFTAVIFFLVDVCRGEWLHQYCWWFGLVWTYVRMIRIHHWHWLQIILNHDGDNGFINKVGVENQAWNYPMYWFMVQTVRHCLNVDHDVVVSKQKNITNWPSNKLLHLGLVACLWNIPTAPSYIISSVKGNSPKPCSCHAVPISPSTMLMKFTRTFQAMPLSGCSLCKARGETAWWRDISICI